MRDSSPPRHAKCCLWWSRHPPSFSPATSKLGGRIGLANGQAPLLIASRNCSLSIDSFNGACECFGEQHARGKAEQKEISTNPTGSGCPQPCSAHSCCRGCRGRGFLGCLGGEHWSGLYLRHLKGALKGWGQPPWAAFGTQGTAGGCGTHPGVPTFAAKAPTTICMENPL